jgi:putative ABC transport system permease protein
VLRLFLKQGMVLTVIGIGAGVACGIAVTRLLRSLLFGVSAVDPLAFGGATLLFVLIALAATYLPARRAARVDPMVALRVE